MRTNAEDLGEESSVRSHPSLASSSDPTVQPSTVRIAHDAQADGGDAPSCWDPRIELTASDLDEDRSESALGM